MIVQTASSYASSATTTSCIANTALALQQKTLHDLLYNQQLILNQITSQSTQAINFLTYGSSVASSGALYLIYRAKDVLGIAYEKFRPTQRVQNSRSRELSPFRITEIGGNRKKYTKKNKRYRKASRKHRKVSRKHRKASRKHRKASRK